MKDVFTELIRMALPAIAGFLVGVSVGGALIWWIFL